MIQKRKETGLAEVCNVIAAQTGLHFPVERWDILGRSLALAAHEFGFEHFDEFTQWLISTTLNKDQIKNLSSFLTISESYFWREQPIFLALTDHILPELVKSKKNDDRTIRLWSAGCSTGEEPYSLAIALHRTIANLNDWNITILATDISPKALSKAKSGVYSSWSFRNCPPWLKPNYFHKLENGQYEILPEIKKMVTFSNLNLAEAIYPSLLNNTHSMDIIFCRNVLMYFTEEWFTKISGNLFQSLNPDGWFVVASCELSSQLFPNLTSVNFPGAIVYRKGDKDFSSAWAIPPFDSVSEQTFAEIPEIQATSLAANDYSIANSEFSTIVTPAHSDSTPQGPLPVPDNQVFVTDTDPSFKIRQLANLGNLPEALALCTKGIAADKLALSLYFLKASILQELDRSNEAVTTLRQAIYLDPDFVMGHFVLGNIYLRKGNVKDAKRHFKNVLDLLSPFTNDDILPESEGLSVKYIREIIHTNMKKLS